MRRIVFLLLIMLSTVQLGLAQLPAGHSDTAAAAGPSLVSADTASTVTSAAVADDSLLTPESLLDDADMAALEEMTAQLSLHDQLKSKFVEGSPGFMSLVALALVLGLAFCIERIIYLTLSEVNYRRLLTDVEAHLNANDLEGAKTCCRNTRGPVASVCYQALLHAHDSLESIERNIMSYGNLQIMRMERGCSWIRLFIAIAPSLGFLGTVIGMVMAFDQIQEAGDISPTIVAEGMKVALITTIFGIIVAVILQVFYNFILTKIDHLTADMEDAAITIVDLLSKQKHD